MRVKDLRDQIAVPGPHPFLYCPICQGEYTANEGDYFMSKPDTVLDCCGVELELVTKHIEYRRVK